MNNIKTGRGWKACYDEERGRYTARTSDRGDFDLYEIDADIFNRLGNSDMNDDEAFSMIGTGRHLYASRDNPIGPPTDIVFDPDYASLCSWTEIRTSGHTSPEELTDLAVNLFENEKTRAHRRQFRPCHTENNAVMSSEITTQ